MPKKQKDGRYRSKITPVKGANPVWISARTLRELEEKKRQVYARWQGGAPMRDAAFHDVVLEWFEAVKKPRIRANSTLINYENAIRLHLLPYFPSKLPIRAVRRADLQRCLDGCAGMSAAPGRLVRSILYSAMKYAQAEGLISSNPAQALALPSCKPCKNKNAFTQEEENRLLEAAASSPDGLMIFILYYTGLRRGEMLGLRWGDFDWKNHLLHVQRSVDFSMKKRGLPQPVSPLKTAAANRFVPIPASLEAILLPLRAGPEELVFSAEGAPLSGSVFRTRWNRLMASADFADASTHITPHHFRHHYITACVAAGLPPEVTMRIAGHSSYQTTIDIYTHLQAETLQKAAFNLDGVLRTTVSPKVAEATSPSDS